MLDTFLNNVGPYTPAYADGTAPSFEVGAEMSTMLVPLAERWPVAFPYNQLLFSALQHKVRQTER